ncbi:MAG TPA: MFS transporter [Candidatus Moranbacteria bacterium]|jgi:MFS family permease|nr:MFS transporter [Candidatus Moranbacteria bacterium]HRZ33918.1 MFS transporter [Candidatus Moranbacteria bacterium]HRZ95891.1 MFS transporter [Candidatus Moranbacteria bacterium]
MFNFKKRYSGISRNVVILGVVSLLTDLSGQMVFPLLPLYITSVLGGGAVAVGLVEGAAEAAASLLKVVSGYWSDKIKSRKPFVFFGYTLSAIMKPVLAFSGSWFSVLLIRILDRVGKGLRDAPRDAIIAESNNQATLGKAYGFNRALDGLGSVGGSVLAFLLLPVFGFVNLFKLAIIPGLVSVGVISLVKEPERIKKVEKKISLKVGFGELTRELKIFILVATIFTLGNYSYAFLMLRAKADGLGDEKTIMLYALFYLVYTLLSMKAGSLSDKFGRKPIILAGYGMFTLLSIGLYLFGGVTFTIISFILFGIFFSLIDGTQRAFVSDLSPARLKGTALGTFHTFTGLAALPAGYIAGELWTKISPEATFLFGAIIGSVSILIFYCSLSNCKINYNKA